jgi:transposase-like protein
MTLIDPDCRPAANKHGSCIGCDCPCHTPTQTAMPEILYCPRCGESDQARLFGIEYPGVYDGILHWECRSCRTRWPRFTEGRLNRLAADKIAQEQR